jgi:cation efflux family protein
MVLKLSVGVISGSVAVLSDGIDSLEDVIVAGITYASLRFGARPPDANHPYVTGAPRRLLQPSRASSSAPVACDPLPGGGSRPQPSG